MPKSVVERDVPGIGELTRNQLKETSHPPILRNLWFAVPALLLAAMLAGIPSARADNVVYTDGAVNGTINGRDFANGFQLGDTFTLAAPSTLTEVDLGVWLIPGDNLTSLDWSIDSYVDSTTAPGTGASISLASVTGAAVSSDSIGAENLFGYVVESYSFSLPSVDLSAGTYWLVLSNGVVASVSTEPAYWDESDGPSEAWQSTNGFLISDPAAGSCFNTYCSEAFQIDGASTGTSGTVPEPSSLTLGVLTLLLAGGVRRLRAR